MPVYRYAAVDKSGRTVTGMMPADDEAVLDDKLRNRGLWVTEAEQDALGAQARATDKRWFRSRSSVRRRELIDFCTLMTFQIRVGVPLPRALEVARQDCKDPAFQKVIDGLGTQLEAGLQLHEAMARYPGVFSKHFVMVIQAGEASSRLPETFDDLKEYLEWVEQIVADIRQATLYPAIVIFVISCFTIFLFTFIIPKFSELLRSLKLPLPMLTKIIFGVGDFARNTWWIWIPLLLILAIGIPIAKRTSKRFLYWWDGTKLKLPIFGELNWMLALSNFSHNLSILYRSGISILRCLEMCHSGLIGNKVIENAVANVLEDVKGGATITEAMHRQKVFSAMLLRMVTMGETTGNLDKALDNVAEYYNDIIPRKIKALFAILEPAIMLCLIFVVGCVALAIYLPIISLMGAIK